MTACDSVSPLHRLIYRSRSALAGSDGAVEAEVDALLARSAHNNARDGVTGALMFTESVFIQVLEGPCAVLENTFERICCDLRHVDVELISFCGVAERAFGRWRLHRVRADAAIEALLRRFVGSAASDTRSEDAVSQAMTLMAALAAAAAPADDALPGTSRSSQARF